MGNTSSAEGIKSVYFPEFCKQLPRMDGKVVAVTGCTTGTGFICARTCAEQGATVIMLNRPSQRADDALKKLKEAVPASTVSLIPCDLQSFASVRSAGEQLRKDVTSGLDVLCNNAGIMATNDEATEDGCDGQMQTNHLSHFLLTAEVWPLLETAASLRGEARVVNHTSGARQGPPLEKKYFEKNGGNLGGDAVSWVPFSGPRWERYHQSKLANMAFTYALRDKQQTVKSLVCHPGGAATSLASNTAATGGMGTFMQTFLNKFVVQSGEDGTLGLLTCCCVADVKSGDFYGPKIMTGPANLLPAEDDKVGSDERKLLWEESARVTNAKFPFEN